MKAPRPATTIDVDELADRLWPVVLSRLVAALGAASESPFTTRKGGQVPPEFSGRPRAWRKLAPTIAGSVRIGRWVSVPRGAYATWVAGQSTPPASPPTLATAASDETWTPAGALEAAGLRPTRKSA